VEVDFVDVRALAGHFFFIHLWMLLAGINVQNKEFFFLHTQEKKPRRQKELMEKGSKKKEIPFTIFWSSSWKKWTDMFSLIVLRRFFIGLECCETIDFFMDICCGPKRTREKRWKTQWRTSQSRKESLLNCLLIERQPFIYIANGQSENVVKHWYWLIRRYDAKRCRNERPRGSLFQNDCS